jgi:AraC-like DNA-binding protein
MKREHLHEQAKFWRDPDLAGLEILHASYLTHSFAPHSHGCFVTSVIDKGAGTIWYRGALHFAPAGSLVLLNPDEMHTGQVQSEDGWRYRALYPSMELLSHVAVGIAERSWHTYFSSTPIIYDQELAHLLHRLHSALAEGATLLERESHLLQTCAHLLSHYAEYPPVSRPVGKEPQAVRLAREYIEAHFARNISLAQLALVSGLTPFQLVRVFHQALGLPPHAYHNQIRLAHAKRRLLAGEPIVMVAYETGFTDQSHLTKRFKRVYGVTPGQIMHH